MRTLSSIEVGKSYVDVLLWSKSTLYVQPEEIKEAKIARAEEKTANETETQRFLCAPDKNRELKCKEIINWDSFERIFVQLDVSFHKKKAIWDLTLSICSFSFHLWFKSRILQRESQKIVNNLQEKTGQDKRTDENM